LIGYEICTVKGINLIDIIIPTKLGASIPIPNHKRVNDPKELGRFIKIVG